MKACFNTFGTPCYMIKISKFQEENFLGLEGLARTKNMYKIVGLSAAGINSFLSRINVIMLKF